ncbi:hypothetical protein [Cribrihabitans neustonicus]|uniref:hypothetical protein n=1 Tax=Cribrihabitans neustonicus TaxID=1429085 RepID=UPI003B5BB3B2
MLDVVELVIAANDLAAVGCGEEFDVLDVFGGGRSVLVDCHYYYSPINHAAD